jgi:hypothetical protein
MDPNHATPRETLRKAIDTEIESLQGSIRVLKYRRNELAPISSLPTEVIEAIFSLLPVPDTWPPSTLGGKPDRLAWLRIAHVCRHWREIALNQPLLWSHVDFTSVSSAGAVEILARAKTVPLHLEAKVPFGRWDDSRFRIFRKELRAHASHIRHLDLSFEPTQLSKTLNRLILPAPTLEYLFISCQANQNGIMDSQARVSIPDTLFDGFAPRLSSLELRNCGIKWTSPLLRGLEHLHIHIPYQKPSLSVWLDALDEMPQLKTLTLDSASPVSPSASLPSNIERTVTLPSLTLFRIDSDVSECGLALAHLILPALITLCVKAESDFEDASDLLEILPYLTRHTHELHHTQPLQSVFVRSKQRCVEILAWTATDIDLYAKLSDMGVKLSNKIATPYTMHSLQVEISGDWPPVTRTEVFDMLRPALPLDGIVTLAVERSTRLDEHFWLRHAPQWPLVQCMQLGSRAASVFREMLMDDHEGRESQLFPLLTKLVLFDTSFSAPRTYQLRDALTNRGEQGLPLKTLDLRRCIATRRAIEVLIETVTEVLGPDESLEETPQKRTRWDFTRNGLFVAHDSSGAEDHGDDSTDSGNDDELWVHEETDDDSNAWEGDFMWSLMDEA